MRQTVSKLKVEQIKIFKIHKKEMMSKAKCPERFKTQMSKHR